VWVAWVVVAAASHVVQGAQIHEAAGLGNLAAVKACLAQDPILINTTDANGQRLHHDPQGFGRASRPFRKLITASPPGRQFLEHPPADGNRKEMPEQNPAECVHHRCRKKMKTVKNALQKCESDNHQCPLRIDRFPHSRSDRGDPKGDSPRRPARWPRFG
jgi:hypothetical protein